MVKPYSVWKHKNGNIYTVVGVGKMQCRDWYYVPPEGTDFGPSVDMEEVVVYTDMDELWVRPLSEFLDGRFTEV